MAAVVSDNDGSAFITKAEFDSLKNNFQSQLDSYNSSIDNKIDNAIASYLAGIKTEKTETKNMLLWGGRKLGLIENEYSRPYVEGRVGGTLDFTLYAASMRSGSAAWATGKTAYNNSETVGGQNPTYFKTCFHRLVAESEPFRYLVVDVNISSGNYYFNLKGYGSVLENIVGLHRTHKEADLTQRRDWSIGLCSGIVPYRGYLGDNATEYTNNFGEFCECTTRYAGYGSYAARGSAFNDHHNQYLLTWQDVALTSEPTIYSDYGYITNDVAGAAYNGVRTSAWHGVNATNGVTEAHTKGEMHMWGWDVADARGNKFNFHIDARPAESNDMFNDGAGVFDRIIQEDPSYSSGNWGHYPSTMPHGKVEDDYPFYRMFKADIGGELTSSNLYSNELADAIKSDVKTGLVRKTFDGVELDVSPLYLGLPIVKVKKDDIVEIELGLLDGNADYDIGFTVGGFYNQPVLDSSYADAGCNLVGGVGHIATSVATGSSRKVKIKIEIKNDGVLFMKYGASGGTSQYIQLPNTCTITKKS